MCVAGTIREIRGPVRNTVASPQHTNLQCGRRLRGGTVRFARNRNADRDHAALVTAVRPRANSRRTGLRPEPLLHDLRRSPVGEKSLRELRHMRQVRIRGRVVSARAAPREIRGENVIREGHGRVGIEARQLFRVVKDVAFQVHSSRFRKIGVRQRHDCGVSICPAGLCLMHDGVIDQREEISFFGHGRLVAIIKEIGDGGDV